MRAYRHALPADHHYRLARVDATQLAAQLMMIKVSDADMAADDAYGRSKAAR